jgi:hypothetical protein
MLEESSVRWNCLGAMEYEHNPYWYRATAGINSLLGGSLPSQFSLNFRFDVESDSHSAYS